jgi:hypothetical protein
MIRMLLLALLALPLVAQVKITPDGNRKVTVEINGKPFTELFVGPETRKPYLSPLRTPSGTIVTRGYPMVTGIAGEPNDHPHHRGLWFTHGDVNGYDFWGNEDSQTGAGKGKGTVVLRKIDKVSGGKARGTIDATFEWKTPDGKVLLTEKRTITFNADPQVRTVDLDVTLSPEEEVRFGDTKEGMFAIRLAAPLEEERGGRMVNAQNKATEKNVWGKRSEWVDYSGEINGEKVGVAIFDHPSNPRHPTYWHARAYGLFATNIFGVHDFENDKNRDGSLTIRPGQPLRFRFRVVIHTGEHVEQIRQMFTEFAAPK